MRRSAIDALPLNGRNFLDLALLAPGVSRTVQRNTERFAETSAVPGTGLSVGGQRNLSNTFIVDGLSANDDAAGLAGTYFAEDVIREFQIVTSGGIAEFRPRLLRHHQYRHAIRQQCLVGARLRLLPG